MMTLVDVRETNFEACLQKEGIRNFQDLCSSISMLGNLQKALKHLKACLNDFWSFRNLCLQIKVSAFFQGRISVSYCDFPEGGGNH